MTERGQEVALSGGRVTEGVVRIDETVRRPMRGDRRLQQQLLVHLASKGFAGTPQFLGVDEQNREILSFLPGDVPADLGHFDDRQLTEAAALLRRFHDATTDFPPVLEAGAEVMCQNDWGPPNCVFNGPSPYGIIDFDTIGPALRLWDLGYSASAWLDIGYADYSADEQLRRLAVFAAGYGLPDESVPEIVVFMVARQAQLSTSARMRGKIEVADWAALVREWTVSKLLSRLLPGIPDTEDQA